HLTVAGWSYSTAPSPADRRRLGYDQFMAVLIPRRHYGDDEMGQISEFVTVTNPFDPTKQLNFKAVVDTGAFGLTLPLSWKDRLGPFHNSRPVELEMADQHRIPAEVCGPVDIKLQGFASVSGEAVFMDGQDDSKLEP